MAKDLWETLFRHPRFVPHGRGHLPEGRGKIELRPAQRIFVINFEEGEAEKRKRFEGKAGQKCRSHGCRTILRRSNRYFYCDPCLDRISKQHSYTDLIRFLENIRRDHAPRQQARRKSA